MPTDDEIAAILARAAARLSPGGADPACLVFPYRPEDAAAILDADGCGVVGWIVDEGRERTDDVCWHAGRGEGRLRPWRPGPGGLRPPSRRRPTGGTT